MSDEVQATVDVLYSLAATPDFQQKGVIFSARQSGLYRSEDGGRTWQFALESLDLKETLATTAVVLSADFERESTIFVGAPGGILRSADRGANWQITLLPNPPPFISCLAVSPNYSQDGMLWAGTMEDGVFCSKDRGISWFTWNFGLLDLNTLTLAVSPAFASDETLFVGTETGVFRSTNGGRAWREVGFPMENAPVMSLALSPDYAADGVIYAGTENHGLWVSADQGRGWRRLAGENIQQVNAVLAGEKGCLYVLAGEQLLFSANGGESWKTRLDTANLETSMTAINAPQGVNAKAPVLVGFSDGSIKLI